MGSDALAQSHNVWRPKYLAIAVGAVMVLFIIFHWANVAYIKYGPRKLGQYTHCAVRCSRAIRRYLARTVFGLSVDRWLLYFVYWSINLILTLTNLEVEELFDVGERLGWISVANLVFLVFLALRNTPLAPLSGRSYEKLRPLHNTAGYTCIVVTVLHATVFLSALSGEGELAEMLETKNLAGGVAGLAMVIIGFSTIGWFVRRSYEAWYIAHIVLFILILIMVGMHRPDMSTSTLGIIIFIACMWCSDRFLRWCKFCWNLPGNHATLIAMSNGAVRVKLSRRIRCTPGSHAFLWIPAIRLIETHPFTLVSDQPVEFLIRGHDGFTDDLYTAAKKQPGMMVRCSVDGGYGQAPNFMNFDRILLVSGGSGASFAFAVAIYLIEQCVASDTMKRIDFVWIMRHPESLSWFEKELNRLRESPLVRTFIYVTRDDHASSGAKPAITSEIAQTTDTGKDISSVSSNSDPVDVEKGPLNSAMTPTLPATKIRKGRPDILSLVPSCIANCSVGDRVGIGACGPAEMLDATRKSVARGMHGDGPSITLHTENFEW